MSGSSTAAERPCVRHVWVLLGHKAGDNNQVLALAEALGWPYEEKRLRYRRTELLSNLLLGATLSGIRRAHSSTLAAPWPDLLITAGRRNEPVARWVGKRSGGHTRVVHLGRPWAHPRSFDLVVTTPQYRVPPAANVLLNELPLHRVGAERLEAARRRWQSALEGLPRPRIALMVGGNSGPYTLDTETAQRLAAAAQALADELGGSIVSSTSRRTPARAATALQTALERPGFTYLWSPRPQSNPYLGYLALADAFIVTGDSVSMLAEACATGKPVYIFDPGAHPVALPAGRGSSARAPRAWWRRRESYRWAPLTHRLAMWLGPERLKRDVGALHRRLVASDRATWLGQPFPRAPRTAPADELERTAARVRSLFTG